MDDVPSAQSVGREFVRQYYTMLNERPESLHRFFSHASSYVHGGIEKPGEEQPPIKGQVAIHQKIMSLGFKDCHAKIRQVDCQETMSNAVVIQVTGELSNNMGPMRRFMQTFILARQSPKMFYVHNDIFRYQDEVFHDFDGPAAEFEENHVVAAEEKHVEVEEPTAVVDGFDNNVVSAAGTTQLEEQEQVSSESAPMIPGTLPTASMTVAADVESGAAEPEAVKTEAEPPAVAVAEPEKDGADKAAAVAAAESAVELAQPVAVEPPVQKPFSWATLASKNASSAPNSSSTASVAPKPQATIRPERKAESVLAPSTQPLPQRIVRGGPRSGDQQVIGDSSGDRKWSTTGPYDGNPEGKQSLGAVVPDSQQLFVGNLPHSVDDKELTEFFTQFGNVVDVKINRKGFARELPNFGFVSFDSVDAVSKALAAKPLYMHGKHRINIEEKKEQSELFGRPRGALRGGRGFGGQFRGSYRGSRGGHFASHINAVSGADATAAGGGGGGRPR